MTQHPEEAVDTPSLPDTCDGGLPHGIHLHTARCFRAGVRAGYAARAAEEAARLAALEAVHWRYFDGEGTPGADDTTPEPEDVWRYDRDFRAALGATTSS